jgi:hypothetical protein
MFALTLWRPWDTAILLLGKPVENRDWPPPAFLIGQRFALHSGKKWDEEGACKIATFASVGGIATVAIGAALDRAEKVDSAIIGTVKLTRVLRRDELRILADPLANSRWFFGAFGWVCEEPFLLPEPIPCRGAQKLWKLPPHIESRVLEQEANRVG